MQGGHNKKWPRFVALYKSGLETGMGLSLTAPQPTQGMKLDKPHG